MAIEIFWFWPQRDRPEEYDEHEEEVWSVYRASAAKAGLDFKVVTADDVTVIAEPGKTSVRVFGREVQPDQCMFHTKLLTWPDYQADVWRFLSTFAVLEAAGFCITVPPMHSVVNNDKLLTVLQPFAEGLPWIPTTRVLTRHFVGVGHHVGDVELKFPLLVKPASWGGGLGVCRADDRRQLNTLLQLAGAAELPMVLQPWLGEGIEDCRVYCINGKPFKTLIRRPVDGGLTANVTTGGSREIPDEVPPQLVEPATRVATALGLAYACVDFLVRGDEYWLSEIEIDGGIDPDEHEVRDARFGAYREQFDAFAARLGKQV